MPLSHYQIKPLRGYQCDGSLFLQAHAVGFLLDDAGLGKSATVLHAADALGLARVLCIGPAVAAVSWPVQLALWSPGRHFIPIDDALAHGFERPGFYFVSYDMLSRSQSGVAQALAACEHWPALILDEAQALKTPAANRTRAVYGRDLASGIADNAERVWLLSGTLTPNHAGEAYTHLRALCPDRLARIPAFKGRVPEQFEFEDVFCRVHLGPYGRVISGSRNMEQLRAVIGPLVLRRHKKDVLPELPALAWYDAPVPLATPEMVAEIIGDALGLPYDELPGLTDDELLARLDDVVMFATRRRLLGLAKVPGAAAWCIDRLESGEQKLIVFAHHLAVLDALQHALADYEPVVVTGGTSPGVRAHHVLWFQSEPRCRVFIGQLQAAGTAITLTAASTVFFAEYATTPGLNYQAASRAHRLGQPHAVEAYFAVVPGSLDERIAAIARRRAAEIAAIFS